MTTIRVPSLKGAVPPTNQSTSRGMPNFKPSKYQAAFLKWIREGSGNASLIAVAGAGKTTTLQAATFEMPKGTTGYAVVFNKKNADELRDRFPKHVACGTFHSFWMRACMSNMRNVSVESKKVDYIILDVLPTEEVTDDRRIVIPKLRSYVPFIRRLVGFAKNAGVGSILPEEPETYLEILEHHGTIDEIGPSVNIDELIDWTRKVLIASNDNQTMIDFDDMLYLPLMNNWGIERRDFVFVDEAQDSNAVQRELVKRMAKRDGRIIFVGDPHQAIYGFRGATNDAMAIISRHFATTELPLTVSYRCPRAVVRQAKQYVNHIEAHDSAPEGEVVRLNNGIPRSLLTRETAILCRVTSALVTLAYAIIAQRIPCRILGREIGMKLVVLIQKMKADSIEDLAGKLEAWRDRQHSLAEKKNDDAIARNADDQCDSLMSILQATNPRVINDLILEIESIFSDTRDVSSMLTLATVHKAKGLEWPTVIIIRPDWLPWPFAKKEWQIEQEHNLAYVAVTRSKNKLVFIDSKVTPTIRD